MLSHVIEPFLVLGLCPFPLMLDVSWSRHFMLERRVKGTIKLSRILQPQTEPKTRNYVFIVFHFHFSLSVSFIVWFHDISCVFFSLSCFFWRICHPFTSRIIPETNCQKEACLERFSLVDPFCFVLATWCSSFCLSNYPEKLPAETWNEDEHE